MHGAEADPASRVWLADPLRVVHLGGHGAPMFHCPSSSCPGHAARLPEAFAVGLGRRCPSCGTPLVAVVEPQVPGADPRVAVQWPSPVAVPYARMASAVSSTERARHAIDAGTGLLRLLALIAVAEYLRGPATSTEVNTALQIELGRALVSSWKRILDAACPVIAADPGRVAGPLPDAWVAGEAGLAANEKVHLRRGWYDEHGAWHEGGGHVGLVTGFIAMRNRIAHDPVPPEAAERARTAALIDVLDRLLAAHRWVLDFSLCRVRGGLVESLVGTGAPQRLEGLSVPPDAASLFLHRGDGARLDLLPLLVVPGEVVADRTLEDGVLLYEKDLGKQILYVGPRGNRVPSRRTVRAWRRLVAAKQVVVERLGRSRLSAVAMQDRAATTRARSREALEAAGAVVRGGYEPRPHLERTLDDWLRGPTPLLAVVGPGGAGKSALLAEVVERWASDGLTVVHLRAAELGTVDLAAALQNHLDLAEDVSPADVAAALGDSGPLVVVLDALDEHVDGPSWLREVERHGADARGLKVVVSSRSVSAGGDPREQAGLWWSPGRSEDAPSRSGGVLRVESLSWDEVCRVWARQSASRRLRPRFGPDQLRRRYRLVDRDLTTPLKVRLWLETFDDRRLPRQFRYGDVRKVRLARAAEQTGDDGWLLCRIARRALDTDDGAVPLDELFDDPILGPSVRSRELGAPYRRLLRHRLLVERRTPDGLVVTAPVPSLLAHAAGDSLVGDGAATTADSLAAGWTRHSGGVLCFEAYRRALDVCVARQGLSVLVDFVDRVGPEAQHVAGVVLAQWVVGGGDPTEAARALMAHPTDGDLHALASAAEDLGALRLFDEGYRLLLAAMDSEELASASPGALAVFWDELAARARDLGHLDIVVEARRAELDARQQLDAVSPRMLALTELDLATALFDLQELDSAQEHTDRARSIVVEGGLADLGSAVDNLEGLIAYGGGVWARAEAAFQRVLSADLDRHGPESVQLAPVVNNLGLIALGDGRPSEALRRFERACALLTADAGDDHVDVGRFLGNVGIAHLQCGDLSAARRVLERAVHVLGTAMGTKHPDQVPALGTLASVCFQDGDVDAGVTYLQQAVETADATLEPTDTRRLRVHLIRMERSLEGDPEELAALIEAVDGLRADVAANPNPELHAMFANLDGLCALQTDRPDAALATFEAALVGPCARLPDANALVGLIHFNKGLALGVLDRSSEAEATLRSALEHMAAGGRRASDHAQRARSSLLRLLWHQDGPAAVEAELETMLRSTDGALPPAQHSELLAWGVAQAVVTGADPAPWRARIIAIGEVRDARDGSLWLDELLLLDELVPEAAPDRFAELAPHLSPELEVPVAWRLAHSQLAVEGFEVARALLLRCLAAEERAGADAEERAVTLWRLAEVDLALDEVARARSHGEAALGLLSPEVRASGVWAERQAEWTSW